MLYDWLYVVYISDYSFLNIVLAKLLSMIYICWTWGKVGFCEMFLNGEALKEWTGGFERRNFCKLNKCYFPYKLCNSLRFIISHYCFKSVP